MIDVTKLSTGSQQPDYALRDANRTYSLKCVQANETVVIEAPTGVESFTRQLVRDVLYHGFRQEYGKGQNLIEFQNNTVGYTKLTEWYGTYGVDAEISLFEKISFGVDTVTTIEARVDMASRKFDGVLLRVEVSNTIAYDKLKARWGTKVSTGPVLDFDENFQETISLNTYPISLFGSPIRENWAKKLSGALDTDWEGLESSIAVGFLTYPTTNPDVDEVSVVPATDMGWSSILPTETRRYLFKAEVGGTMDLKIKIGAQVDMRIIKKALALNSKFDEVNVKTFLRIGSQQTILHQVARTFSDSTSTGVTTVTVDYDQSGINVAPGTEVYLYTAVLGFRNGVPFLNAKKIESYANLTTMDIAISHNSIASDSVARGYRIHDVLERNVLATTGGAMGFDSPYYDQGGCGWDRLLMSGRLLRGLEEVSGGGSDQKYMESSYKELLGSFKAMDGMGMGFEYDKTQKKEYLAMRPAQEFYGDELCFAFGEDLYNYSESIESSRIFNKVIVGYSSFVEDGGGATDEIHALAEWQTPIKFIENSYEAVSQIIASSSLIEKKRRESLKEDNESSKGGSNEESIFIICTNPLVDQPTLLPITFRQPYDGFTDQNGNTTFINPTNSFTTPELIPMISIGASLTISGSALNNKTFKVANVFWSSLINRHVIIVTGNTVVAESEGVVTLTPTEAILKPERNEFFDVSPGTLSNAGAIYNLRLNPHYMLLNQHVDVATCLSHKAGSSLILPTKVYKNETFEIKRKLSDPCPGGDTTFAMVGGRNPVVLSAFAGFDPIQTPDKVSFSVRMTLEQYVYITNKQGRDRNGADYGYVSFVDTCGTTREGYLLYISHKEEELLATVELLKKKVV